MKTRNAAKDNDAGFAQLLDVINAGVTDPQARITPTPEQTEVITHGPTPLLVVAGAGSGKTVTMAQRITYAVLSWGIRPEQVLGLTFTRKAAAQIDSKVNGMLRAAQRGMGIGITAKTYNSFAQQLVREFGLLIGVDPEAKLISETTKKMLLQQLIEEADPPLPVTTAASEYLDAIDQILSRAGMQLDDLSRVEKILTREQFAAEIFAAVSRGIPKALCGKATERIPVTLQLFAIARRYQEYKRAHGLIDFSDQDLYGAKIAQLPQVQSAIRARYQMIVLDEFQDTSETQLEMLSALFKDQAVTAVGDPLQAIYEWRGASAAALAGFLAKFRSDQQATTLTLGVSWRNSEPILAVANQLIEPWLKESGTGHAGRIPGGIRPVKLRHRSYAHLAHTEVPEFREAPTAQRTRIEIIPVKTQIPEKTAALIQELRRANKSTAVLVRKRKEIPEQIAALRRAGIPAIATGLSGLMDEPPVADVIAVLRVLADPSCGPALVRLLNNQAIGPADMRALWEHARGLAKKQAGENAPEGTTPVQITPNLRDAIAHPPAASTLAPVAFSPTAQARVLHLDSRLRLLESKAHLPLPELVQQIIQIFDIDIDLENSDNAAIARACLEEFNEYVRSFAQTDPAASLDRFLSWIDNAQDDDGLKQPEVTTDASNTVQVLTIHASKGLEWDLVVCPSFVNGYLPTNTSEAPWYRKTGGIPPELAGSDQADGSMSLWQIARAELAPNITVPDTFVQLEELKPLPTLGEGGAQSPKEVSKSVKEKLLEVQDAVKQKELDSERRLAYVACTRARETLVIIGAPAINRRGKEPKLEYSIFLEEALAAPAGAYLLNDATAEMDDAEIIAANDRVASEAETSPWPVAVSPQRAQLLRASSHIQTLMQADDVVMPHAAKTPPRFSAVALDKWFAQQEEAIALLLRAREQKQRQYTLPLAGALAVTRVERLLQDPHQYALDERRPMPRKPNRGLEYGEQFHRVMQTLLLKGSVPELAAEQDAEGGEPATTINPAFRESLQTAVNTVTGLNLLDGREVVAVEQDYVSSGRPRLIARVDALLRDQASGNLVIIDWKTGAPREEYRNQVMLYRAVLAETFQMPVKQVEAYLIFANNSRAPLVDVSAQLDPEGKQDIAYWRAQIRAATQQSA